jgi:general secretion pathway protein N
LKLRWAMWGALAGGLLAVLVFLPAAWMAKELAAATAGRLLLAEARGTLWRGNAVLVLTGGPESRDAAALPGRLHWRLTWHDGAPALQLQQACCLDAPLLLRWRPGLAVSRFELLSLAAPAAAAPGGGARANTVLGHWPVAWLAGLGAPLNTLRLSGNMQLSGQNLSLETVQGRLVLGGSAELALDQVASRLSTLEVLGDYKLSLQGDPRGQAANLQLRTTRGALQLSGEGQWAASKFRFSGQASAAPGFESALNNLLNIIGRRQGALSLISIG